MGVTGASARSDLPDRSGNRRAAARCTNDGRLLRERIRARRRAMESPMRSTRQQVWPALAMGGDRTRAGFPTCRSLGNRGGATRGGVDRRMEYLVPTATGLSVSPPAKGLTPKRASILLGNARRAGERG